MEKGLMPRAKRPDLFPDFADHPENTGRYRFPKIVLKIARKGSFLSNDGTKGKIMYIKTFPP